MNRKKRYFNNFWNFNFDEMFRSFEEEIETLRKSDSSSNQEGGPITFGYSFRVGPDTNYQPEIRQWGNLNEYRKHKGLPELHFPLKGFSEQQLSAASIPTSGERFIDYIDEEKYLKIIVEVPGFTKDNLTININELGSEITLKGKADDKEFNETLKLPSKIEVKGIKSTIKNGVLEIRGKKIKDSSKKVKIEID
ncbi:MAG: Hsp20/alpha crystallin family protein [Promethearchaeota archaeon]